MRRRNGSLNSAGRFRCSTESLRACGTSSVEHGRPERFERLRVFLLGKSDTSRTALAREMNTSEGALKVAVHRLRKRFRQEIADTVAGSGRNEVRTPLLGCRAHQVVRKQLFALVEPSQTTRGWIRGGKKFRLRRLAFMR
jgi:hypothetical protein